MKHIKKKTVKRLRDGYHTDLMEMIESSIDLYKEKEFDRGYQSCLEDMAIYSFRLAEHIMSESEEFTVLGKDENGEPMAYFKSTDKLAEAINAFYNKMFDANE